jgi:two-component system, OmpR family, phosphate regulon response regulator PhoB
LIMAQTVLVIEDDKDIQELVCLHLKHSGMTALGSASVENARHLLNTEPVDLAIVDWMLPGASGIELAKEIRTHPKLKGLPLLILTARGREGDKLEGFAAGADDFLVKPFSPRELVARVKSLLRRSGHQIAPPLLQYAALSLDPDSQRVSVQGQSLELSPTEFRLLLAFLRHPERVLTRSAIIDKVWHDDGSVDERTVDVHIRRLRLALRPHNLEHLIETVRGGGYRLALEKK